MVFTMKEIEVIIGIVVGVYGTPSKFVNLCTLKHLNPSECLEISA
jgi:hypothetical protein